MAKEAVLWHDKADAYDFYHKGNDTPFARLYLDLENRAGKRDGAWMDNLETSYIGSDGQRQPSSAYVVCNFMPSSDEQPSLLRPDDVHTLFHELGHATHHIFSQVEEMPLSGVHGVKWDVVEFPSQFLEQFTYDKSVFKGLGKHYKSGETISDDMIDKLIAAKNFQAAMGMIRQCEFALFDWRLHQKLYQGDEVQQLLDNIRTTYSAIIPPRYNKFQNGFSHIFGGGYAAGYYSYKWAEVLSADLYLEYINTGDANLLNAYKEEVLCKGALYPMSELFYNIVQREAHVDALFKLYGMTPS